MEKNRRFLEKLIGLLQIIAGVLLIYLLIWRVLRVFDYAVLHQNLPFTWHELSLVKFLARYHFALLFDLLTIFSGIMLLVGKRPGWLISLISIPMVALIIFDGTVFSDKLQTAAGFAMRISIAFFWLLLFLVLIQKPFRAKYYSRQYSLPAIVAIIAFFLIDRIVCLNL